MIADVEPPAGEPSGRLSPTGPPPVERKCGPPLGEHGANAPWVRTTVKPSPPAQRPPRSEGRAPQSRAGTRPLRGVDRSGANPVGGVRLSPCEPVHKRGTGPASRSLKQSRSRADDQLPANGRKGTASPVTCGALPWRRFSVGGSRLGPPRWRLPQDGNDLGDDRRVLQLARLPLR